MTYTPSGSSNTTLLVRAGVSFISAEQACASAEAEIPDFGFERVKTESRAKWNELLGRVRVDETGVDKNTTALLYSSVRGVSSFSGCFLTELARCIARLSSQQTVGSSKEFGST